MRVPLIVEPVVVEIMLANYFSIFYSGIEPYLPVTFTALAFMASSLTSIHVLLSRREPGSSIAWMALVWLAPLIGVTTYLMFGINRIKRRAESLRAAEEHVLTPPKVVPVSPSNLDDHIQIEPNAAIRQLLPLVDNVVERSLLPHNDFTPLFDGDETYPAMLEAIEEANHSVHLASYIFDNDKIGRRFVTALEAAHKRGVEVRVLIDAAGLRYSIPSIYTRFRRTGIKAVRFLPSILPPHFMTINLRNHRKILVVDGTTGFTGGINIRSHHLLADHPPHPAKDLHFRVQGPVVSHLQEIFAEDWAFCTGEDLSAAEYFPIIERAGHTLARGIPDGPDEDLDKLRLVIKGAISSASKRIRIMTPYFIPDPAMVSALTVAALRGVKVDILLPGTNNLPYVQWASMAHLRPLLKRGCRIYFSSPPFDHTKLMVVDGIWTLVGSANIDPRSLRLNFEFNVECWDRKLGDCLDRYVASRIDAADEMTFDDYERRPRLLQLRDGIASLLSPYL